MKALALTVLVLTVLLWCHHRNHEREQQGNFRYEEETVESAGGTTSTRIVIDASEP